MKRLLLFVVLVVFISQMSCTNEPSGGGSESIVMATGVKGRFRTEDGKSLISASYDREGNDAKMYSLDNGKLIPLKKGMTYNAYLWHNDPAWLALYTEVNDKIFFLQK